MGGVVGNHSPRNTDRCNFPDGHPSSYQPLPTGLNFGEQIETMNAVFPTDLSKFTPIKYYLVAKEVMVRRFRSWIPGYLIH